MLHFPEPGSAATFHNLFLILVKWMEKHNTSNEMVSMSSEYLPEASENKL